MGFDDTGARRAFAPEKLQKLSVFETRQMFCDVYCLEPDQEQRVHTHVEATKFYYVIEGEGTFVIGEEERVLGPGGLAWSEPEEPHGVSNRGTDRLVLLVVMAPNPNDP